MYKHSQERLGPQQRCDSSSRAYRSPFCRAIVNPASPSIPPHTSNKMAKLSTSLLMLVVLSTAAAAFAQPCIECQDCRGMQSCYQVCKSSCPRPQPVVNGEVCKTYGIMSGNSAAQKACGMTKTYCSGGMGSAPCFPVPLSQCVNIAFGTCQNRAMDRWSSPCGQHFNGYKQCDSAAFTKFYTGLVNDGCHQAVSWIQDAATLAAKLG